MFAGDMKVDQDKKGEKSSDFLFPGQTVTIFVNMNEGNFNFRKGENTGYRVNIPAKFVWSMEIKLVEDGWTSQGQIVPKSARYRDGIKYGLICKDLFSGDYILFDNHHPKGPHVHLGNKEIVYELISEEKVILDFKQCVLERMGIKL